MSSQIYLIKDSIKLKDDIKNTFLRWHWEESWWNIFVYTINVERSFLRSEGHIGESSGTFHLHGSVLEVAACQFWQILKEVLKESEIKKKRVIPKFKGDVSWKDLDCEEEYWKSVFQQV